MKIPDNVKRIIDRVFESRKSSEKKRLQEKQARSKDLWKKVHSVEKISVPIPNLFALNQIEEHLGDLTEATINDLPKFSELLWILKNQDNPTVLVMTPAEREYEIKTFQMSISASDLANYQIAVTEIFEAMAKKNEVMTLKMLQAIESQLSEALSALPSDSDSTPFTSPDQDQKEV